MLNIRNLLSSVRVVDNHSFFLTTNLLTKELAADLFEQYPKTGFTKSSRNSGEKKHYTFDILSIFEKNEKTDAYGRLENSWKSFISAIIEPDYINTILKLFGVEAASYRINIGFYYYDQGGWIAPHIDNPGKYFTQIFYFNPYWDVSWGGHLKVLRSSDPDDLILSVPPLSIYTATIFRSDNAWHMVDSIMPKGNVERLSLQLEVLKA